MVIDPLVTVIMPVYNSERYLADAIESVLNQTYDNFEFLIFDDASIDGSVDLIRKYATKDSRIRAFYSSVNLGYVKYLNCGLEEAAGSYVARMDSDDISLKNRFMEQVTFLQRNQTVDVVGSSSIMINSLGEEIGISERESESSYLLWQSFFTNPLAHPSVMFRKQAIVNAGAYSPNRMPSEDYDLWTRILTHGDIANIKEPLLKYRVHESSVSVKMRVEQTDLFNESLTKHWRLLLKVNLITEEIEFLTLFHKGYDRIKSKVANGLFWKMVGLRKLIIKRFGRLSPSVESDFLGKSIYLILKSKSSWINFFLMSLSLAFLSPGGLAKFLIFGKR